MRSASVGFQCPDCVARGQDGRALPRTTFGGRAAARTNAVTLALVAADVAVYLAGFALGQGRLRADFANVAGPALLGPHGPLVGVAAGQYYRLVTAAFLHAGLLHLTLNMVALVQLGPPLEAALGRLRFGVLYGLSALGGSVTAFLLAPPDTLGVGASGAIFGLFGAFYVVARRLGGNAGPVAVLLAVNLVITFAVPFIDWRAHVGGLLTGTVVAAALAYAPRGPRRVAVQSAACVAVLVVLVALVVVRRVQLVG